MADISVKDIMVSYSNVQELLTSVQLPSRSEYRRPTNSQQWEYHTLDRHC